LPIRHVKDTSRLIARVKIRARGRRHYLFAYLWEDREAMLAAAGHGDRSTQALHVPNSYSFDFDNINTWEGAHNSAPPLLSEVHFVREDWTAEIVAHELCHALLHRLRAVGPPTEILLSQTPMEAEEAVCYEFGEWFDQLYEWLWEVDSADGWDEAPVEQAQVVIETDLESL
jgi:hypothetical protein